MLATKPTDPLEELQRENDVIEEVLERLLEVSQCLREGTLIRPGEIAEGLRLLSQYAGLHASRVDHELRSESDAVAMPGCFPHLGKILQDHATAEERVRRAMELVQEYADCKEGAGSRLASALEELATKQHEELVYEGDYPLSCLVTALPEEAADRVASKLGASQVAVASLEDHIHRFLSAPAGQAAKPVKVRCVEAGCATSGEAKAVPGPHGELGLSVPEGGWSVSSREAEWISPGVGRIQVDFRCPSHSP